MSTITNGSPSQSQQLKTAAEDGDEHAEEAIVWVLDAAHASMNLPYHEDKDPTEQRTTRLECMKQVAHKVTQEFIHKSNVQVSAIVLKKQAIIDHNSTEETLQRKQQQAPVLTQNDKSPATKELLCKKIQSLQITGTEISTSHSDTDYAGRLCTYTDAMDFGTGLLLAADAHWNQYCHETTQSRNNNPQQRRPKRRRIILMTDAEHKLTAEITKNPSQIFIALDRLRTMKCSLQVIGFDFESEFPQPPRPAGDAPSSTIPNGDEDSNNHIDDQSNGDDSNTDSSAQDGREEDDDEEDDILLVKHQNERFLVGLAEKTTGGFVMIPKDVQSIQQKLCKLATSAPATSRSHKETQQLQQQNEESTRALTKKRPLEIIDVDQEEKENVKTMRRIARIQDDEGNEQDLDEVQVISPPPRKVATVPVQTSASLEESNDDETSGIGIAWSNMTNPNVDYPHKRVDCGVYKFDSGNPQRFCNKCYCVICDVPAKDCPSWGEHCTEKVKMKRNSQDTAQRFHDILSVYTERAGMLQRMMNGLQAASNQSGLVAVLQHLLEEGSDQEDDDGGTSAGSSPSPRRATRPNRQCLRRGFRFHWDGYSSVSLEDWMHQVRPSRFSRNDCSWIFVTNTNRSSPGYRSQGTPTLYARDNEAFMPALDKLTQIIQAGKRIPAKEKDACVQSLIETAKAQSNTVGKWMLFFTPEEADDVWRTIAQATATGTLGCRSKIAPARDVSDREVVCCCIYVQDFSNRQEVKRVLLALKDLGFTVTSGFKPDFYTELGIYQNNRWRLKPVLYTVKEVLEW